MKKILSVYGICIAALLLVMTSICGFAQSDGESKSEKYISEYYTYEISDGKARITEVDKNISGDIVIPEELGGCPVTIIGYDSFFGCEKLTSIIIPDTVTDIEAYAFAGCKSLENIKLSENLQELYGVAFHYCISLKEIYIPDGVVINYFNVNGSVFVGCESLQSINVSAQNEKYVSLDGILFSKDKATLIAYPPGKKNTEYIVPEYVKEIGGCAFESCNNLKKIVIPEGVTSIDALALWCDELEIVTIPKSVEYIGPWQYFGDVEIYYGGTEKEFLAVMESNGISEGATIYYNSTMNITLPDTSETVTTSFGATVSEWAVPEIEAAFENNLIPEVMLDFDMTKKVNRGEFAAIAVQLYEVLAERSVEESPSCTFTDIQYDDNEKVIKKAYQIEVAQGTSATTYEPLSFINREQLATMLCRVIKKYSYPEWTYATDDEYYMQMEGIKKFADDNEISVWAKPSVYFMAKYGIVKGINNTHFAPKNTTSQQEASDYASATREQAIILAQRIFSQSDMFGN